MSIPVPLTVRLKTRRKDMDVTAQLVDLRFRSSIPGGFATCTFSLNRPLDVQPDEIEYFGKVYVYDGRNGRTIWEGRLEDAGRAAGDRGEVWSLSATGPRAHAQDQTFPVVYVDRSLERWVRSSYSTSKAVTEVGEVDADTPALIMRANEGDALDTNWACDFIYRFMAYNGQHIARVRADIVGDGGSANYPVGIFARVNSGSALFTKKQSSVAGNSVLSANTFSSGWNNTVNVVSFRFQRDTSSTVAPDTTAQYFHSISVRSTLYKADGTEDFTNLYDVNNVDPNEVVNDLLGRILTQFDGNSATVVGSGIDIDQLAYPDGTTAEAIFNDLATFDPGFYWAAWESGASGLHRFEYIPWPSTVRYDASVMDGYDAPTTAGELYNRVHVRWRDGMGRVRNTQRSQSVPDLTDAGLIRTAYIDIADEIGSDTNANYVGDNFLAEHQFPPNAGTLRVARPIVDHVTGRKVMPWEILPGNLIRVQGVMPRVDALNATARDGFTIFRVISVEFSVSDGAATLELDSYSRTVARQLSIADKLKQKLRKR